MKTITIGSLLFGGLTICSAQNVMPLAPKTGVWSLGFMANYLKPQNGTATTQFNATPTYFVSDAFEVGLGFAWAHVSGADSTSVGPLVHYYFGGKNSGQLKPFVGARYQIDKTTGSPQATTWAGQLGAHYFIVNNVALTGVAEYGQRRVSGGANENGFAINFGLTIFFAGSK